MQPTNRPSPIAVLTRYGLLAFAMVLAVSAHAGQISLSPSSVDFGNVEIVAPMTLKSVRLINHGSPTLVSSISSLYGCGEFSVQASGLPVTLQDADTLTFQVGYDPNNWGPDVCSIIVGDDNGVADILGATGTGLATNLSVFETMLTYSQQPFTGGVPETLYVSILNNGNEAITEGHLSLTLQSGVDFSLGPVIYPIASGQTFFLPVIFDPLSQGLKTDQLTLALDNDLPAVPNVTVDLEGAWSDGQTAVSTRAGTATPLRIGPSPTAGTTWIAFTAPRPGFVRLEVRDLAGRQVAQREVWSSATGAQRATLVRGRDWSPAPGVYLVSVTLGDRLIGSGRVVVVR